MLLLIMIFAFELPVEVPKSSGGFGQEVEIGAVWDAIDAVVGAHNAAGSPFLYAALERRLVRVC